MYRLLALLFLFFIPSLPVTSQILPKEGSKLNYRIIGLTFPAVKTASNYKIEIAPGNYNTEDSFKKNIVIVHSGKTNKMIAEVPSFGAEYTWRYDYSINKVITHSTLHHFSTLFTPQVDTGNIRFRVITPATKYKDDFVFLDGNRALYDMAGRPAWFFPGIDDSMKVDGMLSDLKLSPFGTITFILGNQAYEIDYSGNVLWKGPNDGKISGDSIEYYHHEFTRLSNGHYMVLGSEFNWKISPQNDSSAMINADSTFMQKNNGKVFNRVEFGTVIEYDAKGNLVWSWRSSKYFLTEDPFYDKPKKRYYLGTDNIFTHPKVDLLELDVHENAFYFDEQAKAVYVSFKNMSRVVKIKYPEGNVLNTYGQKPRPGGLEIRNSLFCHQHSCRLSKDRFLYLFNNNLCGTLPPKVIVMQEPASTKDTLKKIWEYQCTVEGNYSTQFTSGGNVYELPDRSMFVSMGSQYSKVFIVSRDKKVLWSAMPEKWVPSEKKWANIHQYRSSIISHKELENLIWNSESKK